MRFIKLAIYSILFFFLLITIISLFIPSKVKISRAVDINSKKEIVMAMIKDPMRWSEWYPGGDSLSILYVEKKAEGLILDSSTRGSIILIETNDTSAYALIKTKKSQINSVWSIHQGQDELITLQWHLEFNLRWYPWEKFSSLFFDKIYGAQLERGLEQLKQRAETVRQ